MKQIESLGNTMGPSGDTCKFVSVQTDNYYFYREMAMGKITMYLKYQTHPYNKRYDN